MAIDDCDMEMGQNLESPKISWFTLPNYYQISIMFPMFPNISLPVYSLRPSLGDHQYPADGCHGDHIHHATSEETHFLFQHLESL
jgi:hypothetical protein